MSDNYEIWTTDEVMDYLLVGRNTLYNLLRNGKIKGFKLTNYYRISHAKHLLKNSDTTIPYIASESGINT